jgi:oligoendopeptidase F
MALSAGMTPAQDLGAPPAAHEPAADPAHVWDLTDIYSSVDEWDEARRNVLATLPEIEGRKGTLGESASSLYRTLALISATVKEAIRVSVYASLNADEDLRAGESDYPYELLTAAGVDLATPDPYRAVVARMNGIMDRMEALLAQTGR